MVTQETKLIHIENGKDMYDITFSIKLEHYLYGADADGNRGEHRTEVLETEVIDCHKNGHIILTKDLPVDVLTQANYEVES